MEPLTRCGRRGREAGAEPAEPLPAPGVDCVGARGETSRMTSYEERLETVPSDPEKAASYPELLALWKEQRTRADFDPEQLAEWDRRVLALLTMDERGFYLDERRLAGGTVADGKVNRLAGVLLGRHWIAAEPVLKRAGSLREGQEAKGAPHGEISDDRDRHDDYADEKVAESGESENRDDRDPPP
jgi:hypothetical protein